jgi:hypothetical protein
VPLSVAERDAGHPAPAVVTHRLRQAGRAVLPAGKNHHAILMPEATGLNVFWNHIHAAPPFV